VRIATQSSRRGANLVALVVLLALISAALTVVARYGPAARPAPAGLSGHAAAIPHGGVWHGDTWSASGGTNVTDVANVIGATSSAATGLDGTGVGVALIDSGVVAVPGLPAAQIVNGPDLSFESQGSTLDYLDTFGHGTHMAGIIVGNDSSVGLRGIAPKAKLTSIKVGGAGGVVDVSQMLAAIDWVVKHRNDDAKNPIRVINLSYGTAGVANGVLYDELAFAVENAWRNGIVVVVAGGNAGNSSSSLSNPGFDPYVLAVGSSATKGTTSTSDDTVSTFTSLASGRNVDVVAPGESIVSLRDPGSYVDTRYPSARVGDRLFKGSGSSQSAAVTSGAVALLLQKRPTLTADQVKALIKTTATPIGSGVGKSMGLGEINLATALAKSTPTTTQTWVRSVGIGSIEYTRGGAHVMHDSSPLQGDYDVFGPFGAGVWAQASAAGTAWNGGVWMGRRMAGDGWTGKSWASKTWAGATWSGGPWGAATWLDDTWSGHYWSGHYWSDSNWDGHYWSSDNWSTIDWG
jgi:serine protease AprX